jgi:5-formyltetrahydrofolate cyclo-ligase
MKDIIRNQKKLERKKMSLYEKQKADFELGQSLAELLGWLELPENAKIMAYAPIAKMNEADLLGTLDMLRENGCRVYFPRVVGDEIEAVLVPDFEQLVVTDSVAGLVEPVKALGSLVDSELSFDLMLIPGVAFDQKGNRIGYGNGYYDKFLAKCEGLKVGIGFDLQVVEKIEPIEEWDVKMDLVLTEKGIYR